MKWVVIDGFFEKKFRKNKHNSIYVLLNVFAPLMIGLLIYVVARKESLIYIVVRNYFSIDLNLNYINDINFLKFYLTDCLWAYAFTSSMLYVAEKNNENYLTTILMVLFADVFVELIQIFDFILLSFDIFDIFVQILSSVFSIIIYTKI